MSTYLRNSCIAVLSLFGFSYIYRMLSQRRGPLVRVIVFHDIEDLDWFREIIMFMSKRYHFLRPEDIEEVFVPEKINILVTFDDGYASWIKTLPILDEFGVRALFFINSGLLDVYGNEPLQDVYVKKNLRLSRNRNTVSWEELLVILKKGHTVGGHTKTHTPLSELSEVDQEDTIRGDRNQITEKIGSEPVFFAFPFGNKSDFTDISVRIANSAGYRHLFSTIPSFWVSGQKGVIPRLCLEEGMSTRMLRYWIEGAYDLYYGIKQLCVR